MTMWRTIEPLYPSAINVGILATLFVGYLGLRRYRDPLWHQRYPCPHARRCFFHVPRWDEDEQSDPKRRILVVPSTSGTPVVVQEETPRIRFAPRPWHAKLSIVAKFLLIISSIILILPGVGLVIFLVRQARQGHAHCRCEHRESCRLHERHYEPPSGCDGGSFRVVRGRAGYDDPRGGWRPGVRRRSPLPASSSR